MKFLFIGLLAATCVLSGCGGARFEGTKPGANQDDFARDFADCQAQVISEYGHEEKYPLKTCMQDKNWIMTKP